jgi:hypothetical protein
MRSKDLEKIIKFLQDANFWEKIPAQAQSELEIISAHIMGREVESA